MNATNFSVRSIPTEWTKPSENGSVIRTVLSEIPTTFGVMTVYVPVLMPGLSQTGLHAHEGHEMLLPINGAFDLELDDGYCTVDKQHPIYLPPGKMHRVASVHSPGPCLLFLLRWASSTTTAHTQSKNAVFFNFDQDLSSPCKKITFGEHELSQHMSSTEAEIFTHESPSGNARKRSKTLLLINGSFHTLNRSVPAFGAAVCPSPFPLHVAPNHEGTANWYELTSSA